MQVRMLTFGCKVNEYESQLMLSDLCCHGYTPTDSTADADVIVLNSCTVTATGDQKVQKALRRARREAPNAVIILTGCMTQAFPQLGEILTEADIVVGNTQRHKIPDLLQQFLLQKQRTVEILPHYRGEPFEPMQVTDFYERTRAFVKIEDGCERYCAYCIIPFARGPVRSKRPEDLQAELAGIAEKGYREVVLTGINLSAYGKELGLTLCDAVETACAIPGIERVRLGSLEPEQLEPAVILRLSKQKKLCPQFHLSLQSGCDATLKRMNRHYTSAEYAQIVENLRKAFPLSAMTTDVMVGFAGETEEEFAQSFAFVQKIGFAKVHVFPYSRRPGTAADKASGQVPPAVKEERCRCMMQMSALRRTDFLQAQVGSVQQVLCERPVSPGLYEGYTENYTPVRIAGEALENRILSVQITGAQKEFCTGTAITEEK